jgi:hypothetical protein
VSGWRAGLVAAAVGGLILIIGIIVHAVGGGDADSGATTTLAPGEVTLACVPGIEKACAALGQALGVEIATYQPGAAVAGDAVVVAPAADLPEGVAGQVVGRSPVAIAVWLERAVVLEQACGGTIDLACLESAYGKQWSELGGDPAWAGFNICLADPTRSASALEAWRAVAAAGVPEGLGDSLRRPAADDAADLMDQVKLFGTARCHAVVTTEAAIAARLEDVYDKGRLEVYYPDSGPWVEFVAVAGGDAASGVAVRLLTAEMQALLPSNGLRPVSGEATGLPEGLGTPGQMLGPLSPAERDSLLLAWQNL